MGVGDSVLEDFEGVEPVQESIDFSVFDKVNDLVAAGMVLLDPVDCVYVIVEKQITGCWDFALGLVDDGQVFD